MLGQGIGPHSEGVQVQGDPSGAGVTDAGGARDRIGPGATPNDHWLDPLAKFRQCADRIATAGISAPRGFTAYAWQVVPTLSYISQLLPAPEGLERDDSRWRTKLMHAPFHAIPQAALMHPHFMGMTRQESIVQVTQAARERTALVTAPEWRPELQRLLIARSHGGSLAAMANPRCRGADLGWHSEALVDSLADAAEAYQARDGGGEASALVSQPSILDGLRDPHARASVLESLRGRLVWWAGRVPEGGARWDSAREAIDLVWISLRRCAPIFQTCWINALANAWTTSARAHGGAEPCRFCPEGVEGVAHALQSGVLWGAIERVTGFARVAFPFGRLGLEGGTAAYRACSRYRPPPGPIFQLALASDAVHRARSLAHPRAAVQALVRDSDRRHRI